MEINSFFYTKPIITDYYEKIKDVMGDKIIYNQDDIITYFTDESKSIDKTVAIQNIHQRLLHSDICQGTIGVEYISRILDKVFSPNFSVKSECDICFILNNKPLETLEEKFNNILGFCIVKRGDCPKYGKVYTLNLVCSKREQNVGSIFVGLYLYAILMHPLDASERLVAPKIVQPTSDISNYFGIPIPHIGLLELSGGYKNIPGLCLYSKFGFKIDTSLSGRTSNCFVNIANIGMKNELIGDTSITLEERKTKIINIVKRIDVGFEKHVICNVKDSESQRELIEHFNEIKEKIEELNSLTFQSNFFINKLKDGSLKPEFKKQLDDKKNEIDEIDKLILSIAEKNITGGNFKKKI